MRYQLFLHKLQYQELSVISHNQLLIQPNPCPSSLHKNANSNLEVPCNTPQQQLDLDLQHSNPKKSNNKREGINYRTWHSMHDKLEMEKGCEKKVVDLQLQ